MKQLLTSPKFSWNSLDFMKAALIAGLTVVLTALGLVIDDGRFPTSVEWGLALKSGGLATIAYLIKQFFTSQYVMTPTEAKSIKP